MTFSRALSATLAAAVVFASLPRAFAQTATHEAPTYAPPPPPIVYAPANGAPQPYPPYAPYPYAYAAPELIPLTLDGDSPGMHYVVKTTRRDDPFVQRCTAPCRLELPRGSYRVEVEGDSIPSRSTTVILDGNTHVYSQAGSKSAKNTGLAVAISGTSVAGIGLIVALVNAMSVHCSGFGDCDPDAPQSQSKRDEDAAARSRANVALAVAGVGALVGTIGWLTFAANRTKMTVDGPARPTFAFGVTPTVGGAALGFGGTF